MFAKAWREDNVRDQCTVHFFPRFTKWNATKWKSCGDLFEISGKLFAKTENQQQGCMGVASHLTAGGVWETKAIPPKFQPTHVSSCSPSVVAPAENWELFERQVPVQIRKRCAHPEFTALFVVSRPFSLCLSVLRCRQIEMTGDGSLLQIFTFHPAECWGRGFCFQC